MKIIKALMRIVCFCYIDTMLVMTFADVFMGSPRELIFEAWGLVTAVTALLEIGLTIAFFTVKSIKGD